MMRFFQRLRLYSRLPEMVPAWYFLILAIFQIALAWFFTPKLFLLILFAFNLVFFLMVFVSAVQVARANFAAKLEKNQLESILTSIGQGIIAYDQEFRVWLVNQAAEGIFGLRKEELLGEVLTPERGSDPRYQIVTQVLFPSLAPAVTKKSLAYPQVVEITLSQPR
ncbi:MAG: PAS domain S-box protein, partial [Parcubacteria group bacterium]|nr:PAS domain S-box protein [Parcubacteria group bacterium]